MYHDRRVPLPLVASACTTWKKQNAKIYSFTNTMWLRKRDFLWGSYQNISFFEIHVIKRVYDERKGTLYFNEHIDRTMAHYFGILPLDS